MAVTSFQNHGQSESIPVPYEGEKDYIFVSYCRNEQDVNRVYPIIKTLRAEGYRVWYDKGIQPSSEYNDVIYKHITNCGLLMAFLSNGFIDSDYCYDEIEYAKRIGKKILVIHLESTRPSRYDMTLGRFQQILYYQFNNLQDFYQELYRTEGIQHFDDNVVLSGKDALDFFKRLENGEASSKECQVITELDLRNNWIRQIPNSIQCLTNLHSLNLSSNTLRRLPKSFSKLKQLNKLDLSSNSFFEFPIELVDLPNLRSLNMGGNFLKSLPEQICKLEQLEVLDLYRNWFVDFPSQIGGLCRLTALDASYNQFRTLPEEFFSLVSLEKADLNSTYLKELPRQIINLEKLVTLDLSYNKLKTPLPYEVVVQWLSRGILFKAVDTPYDDIMSSPGINLSETVISNFPIQILFTNDVDKISELYRILDLTNFR